MIHDAEKICLHAKAYGFLGYATEEIIIVRFIFCSTRRTTALRSHTEREKGSSFFAHKLMHGSHHDLLVLDHRGIDAIFVGCVAFTTVHGSPPQRLPRYHSRTSIRKVVTPSSGTTISNILWLGLSGNRFEKQIPAPHAHHPPSPTNTPQPM